MKQLPVATYAALRKKIEETLLRGQQKVDQARVETYWQTGRFIHEHLLFHKGRADYGDFTLSRLADDLDIGKRLLERVLQFYRFFPSIASTWTQLSWSHYRVLLAIADEKKRFAIADRAAKEEWPSHDLGIRVRNLLWDKRVAALDGKPSLLPMPALGSFWTYRIIRPEVIHSVSSKFLVDLGFSTVFELDCVSDSKFQPDSIVTSVKGSEGRYKLLAMDQGPDSLYTYQAFVERVIDGDTLKVEIDLGFNIRIRQIVRLKGIDCPEMDTPEGKAAKRFVEKTLKSVDFLMIKTRKSDKYGRYLGDVMIPRPSGDQQSVESDYLYLNNLLLEKRHAVRVRYCL